MYEINEFSQCIGYNICIKMPVDYHIYTGITDGTNYESKYYCKLGFRS